MSRIKLLNCSGVSFSCRRFSSIKFFPVNIARTMIWAALRMGYDSLSLCTRCSLLASILIKKRNTMLRTYDFMVSENQTCKGICIFEAILV